MEIDDNINLIEAEEKGRGSVIKPSSSRPNFNETIFQKQKKQVQAKLNEYKLHNNHLAKGDIIEKNKIIILNQTNQEFSNDWEWSNFDTRFNNNEELPVESKDLTWNDSNIKFTDNGVDVKKLIFKSKETIKILGLGINLDTTSILKGDSYLWIFTRNTNNLDYNTSVIRINKEEKSQRLYASLGTYIKDNDNNLVFKIFTRQQLIDFNSK